MDTREATQIIDGVMLSDGGVKLVHGKRSISLTPVFTLSQHSYQHVDWLNSVRLALATLGVSSSEPKEYRPSYIQFHSRTHPFIAELRWRWYPAGIKVVPLDLVLTPLCLANWFMGDGLSSTDDRFMRPAVVVRLSSASFTLPEHKRLVSLLEGLAIAAFIGRSGKYLHINVSQWPVDRFMDLVEPFILPSFAYKLKRRHSLPSQIPSREVERLL